MSFGDEDTSSASCEGLFYGQSTLDDRAMMMTMLTNRIELVSKEVGNVRTGNFDRS